MSFVLPINILRIQEEIRDYKKLCNDFQYSPAKKEFEDIINYILLFSGDGIYESSNNFQSVNDINEPTRNYLYRNFIQSLSLNERGGDDSTSGIGDFDTAAGAAVSGIEGAGKLAAKGAESIGSWITYLFKKGKVKSSVEAEYASANERLQLYLKIYELKCKKAELEGKEAPSGNFPGYSS